MELTNKLYRAIWMAQRKLCYRRLRFAARVGALDSALGRRRHDTDGSCSSVNDDSEIDYGG